MTTLNVIRLLLVSFAVVGIAYACIGSGLFQRANEDWFGSLPKHKKVIFSCAIAATLIQSFL